LLRLNVGENRTLTNELLAANGTGFGAVMIKPLEGFNLLRRVTDIFPVIQSWFTILAGHCHTYTTLPPTPTTKLNNNFDCSTQS